MDTYNPEVDDTPLELGVWQPRNEVSIPPDMIDAIAMGLEEPAAVAKRFGFEGDRWERLSAWAPFVNTVAAKRAEYEKNGVTFRNKSALKADVLADQVFVQAMHPDTPMTQKMAVLSYLTEVAELKPKVGATGSASEGFSITINLGGAKTTLEAPKQVDVVESVVDVTPNEPAAAAPTSTYPPLVDPSFLAEMQTNAIS